MPRLRLNQETAKRISAQYGLHTPEQTAEFLGLTADHVRDVWEQGGHPSDEFIAAVLSKCATSFDDVFDVETSARYDAPARPAAPDSTPQTSP